MRSNKWLQLIALLIAMLLWVQQTLLKEQTAKVKIPIRIVNIPENLFLFKSDNMKVSLKVKGLGIHILNFWITNPILDYNGNNLKLGKNTLHSDSLIVFLEKYENLVFSTTKETKNVIVSTDLIVQKKVPIEIVYETPEVESYAINEKIEYDDKIVLISGPVQDINNINRIKTMPITQKMLENRNNKIKFEIKNDYIISIPAQLSISNDKIKMITKTFTYIPIEYDHSRVTIFPNRVSLIIEGKKDSVEALKQTDIKAFIELKENSSSSPIKFNLSKNYKIIDYTPQKVTIKKKEDIL